MVEVEFNDVSDVNHKDFEEAISIYADSVSSDQRQQSDVIKERVAQKTERLFIGRNKNEVVFMALLWPLRNTDFILLDYMAVRENYRNRGIGTQFIKNIFNLSGAENKHFILEVEDPKYGNNREQREKRVEFYRRNGAKIMKNVKYILPPLSGNKSTQMIIMALSKSKENKMDGELLRKIITQIYRELYDRNDNDPLLNSFIADIASTVELI